MTSKRMLSLLFSFNHVSIDNISIFSTVFSRTQLFVKLFFQRLIDTLQNNNCTINYFERNIHTVSSHRGKMCLAY